MTSLVRAPDIVPQCDHPGCLAIPDLAPRIFVPSKAGQHYRALTLAFPHLHYCRPHWESDVTLAKLLDDRAKARFEDRARKVWPHDGVPDFEAALVEPLGIWTPEYEQYMKRLGFNTDGLGFSMHQPVVHPRMAR